MTPIVTVAKVFDDFARYREVDHDDLFEEHDGASQFSPAIINNVAEMLGVSNDFDIAPRESKVTTQSMSEVIANFDEICKILSGTEYEPLLN